MNKYIAILLLAFSGSAIAETYVDGSKPFLAIKDPNRQGEAWAGCAASYEIFARLTDSKPAQSEQWMNLHNGAVLAVGISLVIEGLTPDVTPERFKALWAYSKVAMEEWPKVQTTAILADAEALGDKGADQFVDKLVATIKICQGNLEGQQMYIDTWRELAKSGLLQMPEN